MVSNSSHRGPGVLDVDTDLRRYAGGGSLGSRNRRLARLAVLNVAIAVGRLVAVAGGGSESSGDDLGPHGWHTVGSAGLGFIRLLLRSHAALGRPLLLRVMLAQRHVMDSPSM